MKFWPNRQSNFAWVLSLGLLCAGLALSVGTGVWLHSRLQAQAQSQFQRQTERISAEIVTRLTNPVRSLSGLRGFYAATNQVSRDAFANYVFTGDLEHDAPGVRGFGFVERVARADLPAFASFGRQALAEDFAIKSLGDDSHDEAYVVSMIEPAINNQGALGVDAGSEAVRRRAIEQAVDDGSAVMSGPIKLPQDGKQTISVVIFWPVYHEAPRLNSAIERRAALRGLVIAPIVLTELLEDLDEVSSHSMQIRLTDDEPGAAPPSLLYANALQPGQAFAHRLSLDVLGRHLTLHTQGTPEFEAQMRNFSGWLVGMGGCVTSLLVALLLWQQAQGRTRAESLAQQMTQDLNRLARVAQKTSNAVVFTDLQRRITWVNAGFERLTGYTMAEVLGRSPALLQTPQTNPQTVDRMSQALGAAEVFRGELLNRGKDGRDYWIELEIQPVHDEAGQPNGFMAIETDITERRQARQALEAALRDNEALINTLDLLGIVSVANAQGQITQVNDAFCHVSGYEREELLGQNHRCLNSGHHLPEFWVRMWSKISIGLPWRAEVCNRAKDGTLYWVDTFVAPFINNEGEIDKYVAIFIDITDKKRAEEMAERNAALLRGSIDALDDAFALYDNEDRLALFNRRYHALYPLNAEMVAVGNRFEDIVRAGVYNGQYEAAIGREEDWIAQRLALHQQPTSRLTQKLSNGRTLQVVERRMANGYTVGFRVDITELVQATEAAQEASRSKSQFLANMSHELRTPMNAVLGMLTLLRKTPLSPKQADYAAKSEAAAQSLLALLNDILDLSKAEAGKMQLDPQPTALAQLVADVNVIVQAYIGPKPVELLVHVDSGAPSAVEVDALRLKQVLINLCGNAVKFTPAGRVTLRVVMLHRQGDQAMLQFSVQDQGIGIAPEHQSRIFAGFTQAEASTTRRFGGTGLGLAISQRLLALMGSQLELQSEPGKGSHFSFNLSLPVATAPQPPAPLPAPSSDDPAPAAPVQRLQGMRILLAEDNLVNQQIAMELLSIEGAKVTLANHGQEAVDQIMATPGGFDVVLMDMQMPVMDGLDATRAIRQRLSAQQLPIVAMTANAMESDRQACLQAGMNDHVGKPFNLAHLVEVIRSVARA
jgi:PAS domain S-box-containing protein